MEKKRLNGCDLSGSRYCRLLNMGSCENCPAHGEEDTGRLRKKLDELENLLPEQGIAHLFLDDTCQFCRRERRHGYALLDMAHPEPKRIKKKREGILQRQSRYGIMIPLQLGICDHCRRRFLLTEYLPLLLPVLVGGIGLILLYGLGEGNRGLDGPWPFLCWIGFTLAALFTGRLLARALKKRMGQIMLTDGMEHPVIREMTALGWQPVAGNSRNRLLFSRSRIARGLGTAIPEDSDKIH